MSATFDYFWESIQNTADKSISLLHPIVLLQLSGHIPPLFPHQTQAFSPCFESPPKHCPVLSTQSISERSAKTQTLPMATAPSPFSPGSPSARQYI